MLIACGGMLAYLVSCVSFTHFVPCNGERYPLPIMDLSFYEQLIMNPEILNKVFIFWKKKFSLEFT